MYYLDIAIQTIAWMQSIKSNDMENARSRKEREELQEEIRTLRSEEKALYQNDEYRDSLIDKIFSVYSPILKARMK